jgi:hypothetical protein
VQHDAVAINHNPGGSERLNLNKKQTQTDTNCAYLDKRPIHVHCSNATVRRLQPKSKSDNFFVIKMGERNKLGRHALQRGQHFAALV